MLSRHRHHTHALLGLSAVVAAVSLGCSSDNNNSAPPVASAIMVNAADTGQTGTVGTILTSPILVTVSDQAGNPVPNATVTWTVTSGLGSVSEATTQTGSTGQSSVVWTLGSLAGVDSLVASIPSGAQVKVGATAVAGALVGLVKVSGDLQTVTSGSTSAPLIISATDAFGNPVANAAVAWSVQGGGTLSGTSSTTGANGQSQVTLTLGSVPGTYTITATIGQVSVTFTLTGD